MADLEIKKSGKALLEPECAFCYAENLKHSPNRKRGSDRRSRRKEESARSDSPILEPHTKGVCGNGHYLTGRSGFMPRHFPPFLNTDGY